MGMLITKQDSYKEFLKGYNLDLDDRLIIEYNLDKILNQKLNYSFWLVLDKGDIIRFNNILTPYLGRITNPKTEIDPYVYSIYRINRRVYYHKAIPRQTIDFEKTPVKKVLKDTSEPLNITINENDNELLIIAKELLKGMTINTFKNLFDSVSDYNNIKREILEGNKMTWNRFLLLIDLLGFSYNLQITQKPEIKTIQNIKIAKIKKKK